MKLLLSVLLITSLFSCGNSHENHFHEHNHHEESDDLHSHGFNANLAEELGADQFGMRKYVMAYLKAGPNRDQNEEEVAEMQKAHLENIQRMAEVGQLVLAGPFLDEGPIRGIYIFDVETIEEAQVLTESDPMIASQRLVMELHPWYGSAALKKVNEIHNSIQNTSITAD